MKGLLLGCRVDLRVSICRLQAGMTEPTAYDVDFNARFEQVDGGGVPEYVWRDSAFGWVRLRAVELGSVAPDQLVDAEAAQWTSAL